MWMKCVTIKILSHSHIDGTSVGELMDFQHANDIMHVEAPSSTNVLEMMAPS